ncbi:MAG: hypothetical protein V3S47_07900 [Acidobacteriota bacterium]
MLRTIRAFLWMRWRVSRNAFKSRQRDSLEQISRALGALAPFFLLVMLVPTVLGLAAGGLFLGVKIGQAGTVMIYNSLAYLFVRIGLATATVILLIAPMVRSSRGTGSEMTRLLLLPIRRSTLHASEVIGALNDPWLAVLFPALILFPIGIVAGGSYVGGVISLAGAVLFVSIMMLVVSLASFTIALIFRKRQRAERFTAGLIVVLSMSGLAFGLLGEEWGETIERKKEAERIGIEQVSEENPGLLPSQHFDNKFPPAIRLLPSEAFMRLVEAGVAGRGAETGFQILVLMSWTGLLYAGSRWTYSRLLETPETGPSGKTGAGLRTRSLPGVRPNVSAVALATMRLALRTVRGKTGVYLNFPITAMIYIVLARQRTDFVLPDGLGFGMGIGLIGGIFTLISLQPILINVFAIDANGLTLQLLSPLSTVEILHGKLLGGGLLVAISTGLCFVAGFALDPSGSPILWLVAAMTQVSLFLMFAPIGLLLSMVFPKAADLSRMGKDGNPQPIAVLVATLAVPLLLVPPGLLLAAGLLLVKSVLLTAVAASVWFGISLAICALSLRGLVNLCERRRENLLLVATGH